MRCLKTRKAVDSRVLTFAGPPDVPDDVDVGLLPELVALAEVAAEVVLVLHHVAGDGQADGRGSGRGQHTRQPVLPAGVVVAGLKQGKVKIFPQTKKYWLTHLGTVGPLAAGRTGCGHLLSPALALGGGGGVLLALGQHVLDGLLIVLQLVPLHLVEF